MLNKVLLFLTNAFKGVQENIYMPSKIIKYLSKGMDALESTQDFHSNLSSFNGNNSNMYARVKNNEEFEVRALGQIL